MQHKQTHNLSIDHGLLISVVILIALTIFGLGIFSTQQSKAAQKLLTGVEHFTDLNDAQNRRNKVLNIPIFLYHYIEVVTDKNDTIRKSLALTPTVFSGQIETLLANGYTPVTVETIFAYYDHGAELPQKPVIFSFDDGYRDFYTDVLPILKKYHVPAVLYVVPGFLDTTKNYLTTDQFKEIVASGLVEIGAHTMHHLDLVTISVDRARNEILQSKTTLEQLTGKPVLDFAYPYGKYSQTIENLVSQAGFRSAVTVDKGIDRTYSDRLKWKRLRPGSNTGNFLIQLLQQKN